ncbi:MAG: hypothetical protein JWO92_30 [Chitinophagaceae bacterium]|nr:hypothetical protein [Chitinophagaceae bacterium]
MNFSISDNDLKKYLFKFFGSLSQYPQNYLPLIFDYYTDVPKHLAYVCPLCLKSIFYTENIVRHFTDNFSLDHFPPKNVGGKQKMMICKKCNNTAGYSYENSLKDRVIREAYNRKINNIEVSAKTNIENVKGWLHGAVSITDTGDTVFRLTDKAKNRIPPLTMKQNETNNGGKGFKMNITISEIDKKKATKALLKTAYLYCFDYWGYEFVFSFAGKLLRDVLNDIAKYPIDIPTLWFDNKAEIHKGIQIPTGMVFIQKPKEIMSMFVNIPLSIKQNDYKCIVPIQIPNPDDIKFENMIRVQQFFYDNPSQQIFIKPMPFEFNMHYPNPYSKSWEELKKLSVD